MCCSGPLLDIPLFDNTGRRQSSRSVFNIVPLFDNTSRLVMCFDIPLFDNTGRLVMCFDAV